ncbi:unnamed protein product [Paramecium sonneborni]|uniref:Uncharacterized protein n=1 Tax=Paramecium sonneborni TaxID=65129 RepID=A0A8S1RPX0_9CILI|nr:unnamed protein product [Paramecium sonneborni]
MGYKVMVLESLKIYINVILDRYKKYSGGGSYDKEENQIKIGNWVEFDEEFHDKKQVISHGEYNKNGLKVG